MNQTIPATMRVPQFVGEGRIGTTVKPVPEPGPGQLLLRVRANALCGSERGQFFRGSPNVTPGHEAAGVVVAAGPGTTTPVGTPGVVYLMDFCGECRSCGRGWTNLCLAKRGDMGFSRDGGYGAYELIHENVFFAVPDDLPPDEATLLLDVMGTGGHAIEYAQRLCAGPDERPQTLLVIGAGPIGLAVLAMARLRLGTAARVFIADILPYRLEMAERLGGVPLRADSDRPVSEQLRGLGTDAVDAAIDTSGNAGARQAALPLLDRRGLLLCVGHGGDLSVNVSRDLIQRENLVAGSEYFRFDELAANRTLLRDPAARDYLRPIITHRFPVEEITQAFERFWSGATGKVVVVQED